MIKSLAGSAGAGSQPTAPHRYRVFELPGARAAADLHRARSRRGPRPARGRSGLSHAGQFHPLPERGGTSAGRIPPRALREARNHRSAAERYCRRGLVCGLAPVGAEIS